MSEGSQIGALAPFRVRSFRFQWGADLATSWAFEMETLILGWYVLVATGSVLMLTVFASLQYLGTLIAPMFGVAGDRIGHRNLLCGMRGFYVALATTLMTLAFTGLLTPVHVFVIAALMGLVRPSDIAIRAALIAETMPSGILLRAMSISRTTLDTARIAGALTGAGLFAMLGMGPAYLFIAFLYFASLALNLQVPGARAAPHAVDAAAAPGVPASVGGAKTASPWRDLQAGLTYVWNTPHLLAMMCLAFLINLTAFPLMQGLLPYVAKEIYGTDQTGLGYMVAAAAAGALLASVTLARHGSALRLGRTMIVATLVCYLLMLGFAQIERPIAGILVLALAGVAQNLSQTPMAALLLRNSEAPFRGRVMGIRMLVIYGLPTGLLIAGPAITRFGYQVTATSYCLIGLTFTLLIAVRWRRELWRREAALNKR